MFLNKVKLNKILKLNSVCLQVDNMNTSTFIQNNVDHALSARKL